MAHPRLTLVSLNGFPEELHPSGKILTISFIEASSEVIGIIGSFGKLFTPVVMDMQGNVDRLKAHYQQDEKTRMFIEDMILSDKDQATHSWLLWLKRALEMIERFFWFVLNDDNVITQKTDNMQPLINQAYNEVLKPYHGFFLQNGFKLINRYMPSRSSLLGNGSQFEENIKYLRVLQPKMKLHIDKVNSLYRDNDLNYDESV